MRKKYLPLFWKFTIALLLIVLIYGFFNVFMIKKSVKNSLVHESEKKGLFIAKSIAEKSVSYILFDDISSLYISIDRLMHLDSSIHYIFILNNNNEVVAHTFKKNIPGGLIEANPLKLNQNESTILVASVNGGELIRDIAVPVIDKEIGIVRIGLLEEDIKKDISNTIRNLIFMIVLFLIGGIIGAFLLSYIITYPVKFISNLADKIDIISLQKNPIKEISMGSNIIFKLKRLIVFNDEIDILTEKFNQMLLRLKKTHEELQLTQASLKHSERLASIGTLTAGLAHEINNPVAGIKNCIHRLSKDPDNIKQNMEYLAMMEEASNKVSKVLQSLLNFSRKQKYSFQKTNICVIIENVLTLVAYELESSHISIIKDYSKPVPFIKASSGHVEQVIINLFLNSIDAIKERINNNSEANYHPVIRVKLSKTDEALIFSIIDNGIGIKDDEITKIFDPFYTTKKLGQGTGLGLSISYKILEDHNGRIFAENNSGLMSFTIELPIESN